LLRNGLDYLAFHEYARALSFLKAAESRQAELSDTELQSLKKGISQAQQGLREAVNSPNIVAQGKGRTPAQPGSIALVKPAVKAPIDAIQRTSVDMPAASMNRSNASSPALPAPIADEVALPTPTASTTVAPLPTPTATPTTETAVGVELPPLPDSTTAGLPELPATPTSAPSLPVGGAKIDRSALPAQSDLPVELPPTAPNPLPAGPPPPLVLESSDPTPAPSQVPMPAPTQVELPTVELPPVPTSPPTPMPVEQPLPSTAPAIDPTPRAMVAEAAQRPDASAPPQPTTLPEPPPAAEAPAVPDVRSTPSMPPYPSTPSAGDPVEPVLGESLKREVEEKFRRNTQEIAQRPGDTRSPGGSAIDPNDPGAMPPSPGSPRLEITRAPSPTEARPLRRISTPEEVVNLGKREWDPNRKYWAAAGTCHMILYFQDPVLERYGQGVEQSLGPWGRYFSYPLDDPRQSNQRNQILQPFYSMGKFCFQVGTLPYKMVVDPPWEAEYDLGYYRPGDRIPPDTIFITPYGVGPPLKGRNY
jgi:hypothetical protein